MSEEKDMTEDSNVKEGVSNGEVEATTVTTDNAIASPSASNKVAVKKEDAKSISQSEVASLDYNDFTTPARMLALGEALAKSKLCIHKTKEDFALAMMLGQDLGLPVSACLSQVYAIEGKATLGVHLQRALVLKAGITYEKIEDFATIFSFAKKEGEAITDLGQGTLAEQPEGSVKKAIDTRTTYKFTRLIKRQDGSWKEMVATGSFSIAEAKQAQLLERPNYLKYPRRMLDARAWSNGAREIAGDILNGIMTPAEMGVDVFYTESGEEKVIEVEHTEVK